MTTTSAVDFSRRPMEERMAGQEPGLLPTTWKESVGAAEAKVAVHNSSLMGERIPDSDSQVVVVGAAWVALIDQVGSAQQVDRKQQGQTIELEFHAGSGFDCIGP